MNRIQYEDFRGSETRLSLRCCTAEIRF